MRLQRDTAVCRYDFVELRNLETNPYEVNYQWSTGNTSNVLKAYDPGVYWLDVSSGCTNGKVRDSITIVRKIDDCECFLYVPNAFTPNGDGKNDRFSMKSECIVKGTLEIYNRWGELLFVTSDVLNGWNGLHGTIPQPAGLYVYNIRYEYERRPGVYNKKGTVHLLH